MTKQNKNQPYPEQVAELTELAFQSFGYALASTDKDERTGWATRADLQIKAAQAVASLASAAEARIQSLIQIAALETVGGNKPDAVIAQEAYAAAAVLLGLADPEDGQALEELRAALGLDDDAKDAELGDLP